MKLPKLSKLPKLTPKALVGLEGEAVLGRSFFLGASSKGKVMSGPRGRGRTTEVWPEGSSRPSVAATWASTSRRRSSMSGATYCETST